MYATFLAFPQPVRLPAPPPVQPRLVSQQSAARRLEKDAPTARGSPIDRRPAIERTRDRSDKTSAWIIVSNDVTQHKNVARSIWTSVTSERKTLASTSTSTIMPKTILGMPGTVICGITIRLGHGGE